MRDFRKSKLMDQYRNDAAFNKLVSTMRSLIQDHGFTPSETREAAFLAHYLYEMEDPLSVDRRFQAIVERALGDDK